MAFPFDDTVATAIGHYLLIEEMESRTADQIPPEGTPIRHRPTDAPPSQRDGESLDKSLFRK